MPFIPVLRIWNGVATMGKAFFGALPMVTHFFVLRGYVMENENLKVTNSDDKKLQGIANAKNAIVRLEKMLVKTFDKNQMRLYYNLCEARKYYKKLKEEN